VLGLTAVMADGSILSTGSRSRKSSSGYDLTHMLCGSEGTLGVITELILRLHAKPKHISAAVCAFKSLRGAVEACQKVAQTGLPVAKMELLDATQVVAVNAYSNLSLPPNPHVFFEFHGTNQSALEELAAEVGLLAAAGGGDQFQWAADQHEREQLWIARKSAYFAAQALRPGCRSMPTDVCVPVSSLAECVMETVADLERTQLIGPIVGHVGDGNFHVLLLLDPGNVAQLQAAKAFSARLVERALKLGGTASGEHGVGYGKLEHMELEHGASGLAAMRAIKLALDPKNILNPGKLGS